MIAHQTLLLPCLVVWSLVLGSACSKHDVSRGAGRQTAASDANFEKPVSASSVLSIGRQTLVGTKVVAQNEVAVGKSAGLEAFQTELYPKLRQYCAAGCHDVNLRPFASDGVTLAYEIAKPFITDDPESSQMVRNIKAGHNGVDPDWAAEVAAAIAKVALANP